MYFIIGIWGGKRRIYATMKFFLFTMAGSLLMFIAILYAAGVHSRATGLQSFSLVDWTRAASSGAWGLAPGVEALLFGAFALAFLVKVPLWPLHTWLPDAHVEAPTGGSIILAGVLLKLGTYGLLRFAWPLFPDAAARYGPFIAVLALIGIVYGAWVAAAQKDMKKLVAYSSVSHLALVVLGIVAGTGAALSGRDLPDDRPRPHDGPPLPPRRRPLRAAPHARDGRLRRHRGARARDDGALPDRHARLRRASRA